MTLDSTDDVVPVSDGEEVSVLIEEVDGRIEPVYESDPGPLDSEDKVDDVVPLAVTAATLEAKMVVPGRIVVLVYVWPFETEVMTDVCGGMVVWAIGVPSVPSDVLRVDVLPELLGDVVPDEPLSDVWAR